MAETLTSGDHPACLAVGIYAAKSIRLTGAAIFMVDVLGRVRIMPKEAIQILARPRIEDSELDTMSEEVAIDTMVTQGDSEDTIVTYLKGRKGRMDGNSVL